MDCGPDSRITTMNPVVFHANSSARVGFAQAVVVVRESTVPGH